jgi:adenosylcobinamide kinase/adenosylcobinamide-phosphate guanylyltransferase
LTANPIFPTPFDPAISDGKRGRLVGKLILILGGARSGKSAFAEELAKDHKRVAYIATALVADGEMRRRVALHRKRRPKNWVTYEANAKLDSVIRKAAKSATLVLVDCMTLYLSNTMMTASGRRRSQEAVLKDVEGICRASNSMGAHVVVVSNEVGLGIVPDTPLGREFRDLQGRANQTIARAADEVYFVVAGIPQRIK